MARGGTLHHFPTARRATAGQAAAPRRSRHEREQTVLVVDDQHVVLELVDAFLEDSDYRIYMAGSGRHALETCRRLRGRIDLLLTDVRMPGMNGPELYQRVLEDFPDVKVLYMSGFSPVEAARFGVPEDAPLVIKPFRPGELVESIRQVLEGTERSAAGPAGV